MRVTNLDTTLDSINFVDLEDNNKDKDLDLLLVYKGLVGKRASATIR